VSWVKTKPSFASPMAPSARFTILRPSTLLTPSIPFTSVSSW
jgi:hypothetical protein